MNGELNYQKSPKKNSLSRFPRAQSFKSIESTFEKVLQISALSHSMPKNLEKLNPLLTATPLEKQRKPKRKLYDSGLNYPTVTTYFFSKLSHISLSFKD